jgi:prepilin-type N-terminal cleavage/methylation domain-containing protein
MIPGFADQRGFTLVELLIASLVTVIVLGGAVALTSQVQNAYRRQMEEAAAVQEGRNALDWIGKYVRGAGNNPYLRTTTDCPSAGTVVSAIRIDPDDDGVDDDIRLMTDSSPADGIIGGPDSTSCTQANEDVTIRLDTDENLITVTDNNLGTLISRTDSVVSSLSFAYYDTTHAVTTDELQAVYVKIQLTVRTRTLDPSTGAPVSRALESEVRVRSR